MESNLSIKTSDIPKFNIETVSSAIFGKEESGNKIGGGSGESIKNIHEKLSKLFGHIRKSLVRIKALEFNVEKITPTIEKVENKVIEVEKIIPKIEKVETKVIEVEKIIPKIQKVETKLVVNTEKTTEVETKVIVNTERIVKIEKILENKKDNVGGIGGNQKDLTKSLIETNKILVQIQQELMKNISIQSGNEKDKQDKVKRAQSKNKLKKEESQLEKSSKKLGSSIAKASDKILSPVKGIFGQIMDFVGTLVLGIGANAIFKWLENKENQEKVQGWFDWIKDHWKWVAAGIGVLFALPLVGAIAGVISTIGSLVGVIAALATPLLGLMLNPLFWKILLAIGAGILIYKGGEWVVKGIRKNMLGGDAFVDADDQLNQQLSDAGMTSAGVSKNRSGQEMRTNKSGRNEEQEKVFAEVTGKKKQLDELKNTMEAEVTKKQREIDYTKLPDKPGDVGAMGQGSGSNRDAERLRVKKEVEESYSPKIQDIIGSGEIEARAMGGPVSAGTPYLVGERGPEIFSPNIDGSVVNNMRTEKIYEMITSKKRGRGGVNIQTLPTITNQLPPPEVKVPSGPATEVPNISSVNMADPYRQLTPMLYGITV